LPVDLSVAIVNWNTKDDLRACLRSVQAALAAVPAQVIVVDNASSDGSAECVRTEFPWVELVENRRNAGFARANNQAFERAAGRSILLLNPDTAVNAEAIHGLMGFLEKTPSAGAAGLQLRFPDGQLQNSYDSFPTFGSELLSKHLMRLLFPARYPSKRVIPTEPLRVDIVIGACLILRREVVDTLGGFDEGYFLFVEEADLCWRIWRAGWEIYHLPHLSIVHDAKKSKAQATAHASIEYARSSYRFYRKSMPLPAAWTLRALKALKVVLVNPVLSLAASGFTLGRVERHVRRLRIRLALCAWHLLGCPVSWGMRQVSALRDCERRRAGRREAIVARTAPEELRRLALRWVDGASEGFPEAFGLLDGRLIGDAAPGGGSMGLQANFHPLRTPLARLRAVREVPEGIASIEKAADLIDRGVVALAPVVAGAARGPLGLPRFSFEVRGQDRPLHPLSAILAEGKDRSTWCAAAGRYLARLHSKGIDIETDPAGAAAVPEGAAPGREEDWILRPAREVRIGAALRRGRRLEALERLGKEPAAAWLSPLLRRRFLGAYWRWPAAKRSRRPIRVLHLFSNHKVTGPAETALDVARALDGLGSVEAHFLAGVDKDGSSGLRRLAVERGGRVADLGLELRKHFAPFQVRRDASGLRQYLREAAPDIVHCHLPGDHLVASLAVGEQIPIVRSFYGGEPPPWDWRARRTLERFAARIVCFSKEVSGALEAAPRSVPAARVVSFDPPIDLHRFDRRPNLPDRRRELGIPAGGFTAGISARLQTHRRFEVLFAALALARREIPDFRFVIIGRGTHADSVARAPVRDLGLDDVVRLTGYLSGEEYVATLAALDAAVFLVPGSDGTCRAVREKLAMGLPVIAARRGMLPELVRDGVTGVVIDDSAEAIAGALVDLARDVEKRRRLAAAARAEAEARFSYRAHAENLLGLYLRVLEERASERVSGRLSKRGT